MASGRDRCTHHVALPEGYVAAPGDDIWWPTRRSATSGAGEEGSTGAAAPKPAKEFPFKLDAFQELSMACLERGESVMVAAHTSSGKTAVAEYAVAMAFRDRQRVLYTSPLKALSNQKFRDLCEEFGGDVGLMTGDVSINPDATCIVMTTEIMRSMIYRGSEIMREVKWVIFDEVHYMRDRERGVVWEESIIFAPPGLRMVFLSATLSNATEFVEWIAHLRKEPCHVVYTDHRIVPLEHYAFPQAGDGIYLICDANGNFREDNVVKMLQHFELGDAAKRKRGDDTPKKKKGKDAGGAAAGGDDDKKQKQKGRNSKAGGDVFNVVRLIMERCLVPVIVFSFSRRECEYHARAVAKLNFNSEEEADTVEEIYRGAMDTLPEADRNLPPVASMLSLLRAGVGIHHSGLLPVVKELVEILFQEGLIKALFATETFAMGLNMPARTVVFTSVRKWDGEAHRWMGSGEYIQMSGRAGRRGKDDRGVTVMMVDEKIDADICREMVQGKASPLQSTFRLSYYSLLNLLSRAEGLYDTEYVISHSFHQFQHEKELPMQKARAAELEALLANAAAERARLGGEARPEDVGAAGGDGGAEAATTASGASAQAGETDGDVRALELDMLRLILRPKICLPFLTSGRVLRLCSAGGVDLGWGILYEIAKSKAASTASEAGWAAPKAAKYSLNVAVPGASGARMVQVPLPLVTALSAIRVRVPIRDFSRENSDDFLSEFSTTLQNLSKRFGDRLPLLDPIKDLGIPPGEFAPLLLRLDDLKGRAGNQPATAAATAAAGIAGGTAGGIAGGTTAEQLKAADERIATYTSALEELRQKMRESHLSLFKDELKARSRVLRRLGHVDENDVVQLKGRAACQIDTSDELMAAELMFDGTFSDLDHHSVAALASCLIPMEKSKEAAPPKGTLKRALDALRRAASRIAELSRECGLEMDVEEYVESFGPDLMEIVHAWSRGADFGAVTQETDLFEGSIVRAMRRLDELLQQMAQAAEAVGDAALGAKFTAASESIRRGVVFSNSLYLAD